MCFRFVTLCVILSCVTLGRSAYMNITEAESWEQRQMKNLSSSCKVAIEQFGAPTSVSMKNDVLENCESHAVTCKPSFTIDAQIKCIADKATCDRLKAVVDKYNQAFPQTDRNNQYPGAMWGLDTCVHQKCANTVDLNLLSELWATSILLINEQSYALEGALASEIKSTGWTSDMIVSMDRKQSKYSLSCPSATGGTVSPSATGGAASSSATNGTASPSAKEGKSQGPKFDEKVDLDKDGKISEKELVAFYPTKTEAESKKMFAMLDQNKDQNLNQKEFSSAPIPAPVQAQANGPPAASEAEVTAPTTSLLLALPVLLALVTQSAQ